MCQGRALFPTAPLIAQLLSLPSPSLTIYLKSPCHSVPMSLTCVCLCFPLFPISVSFCFSLSLCLFLCVCPSLSLSPLPLSFLPSPSLSFKPLLRTCSKIQETITFTRDAPALSQGSLPFLGPVLSAIPQIPFQEGERDLRHFYPLQDMYIFKKISEMANFTPKRFRAYGGPQAPGTG